MIPNIINRRRPPRPEPELKLLPVPDPKPKLEMRSLPVFRVKQKALEAYITLVYRFEFDFLIATGHQPGLCPQYHAKEVPDGVAWKQRAHELRCGKRTRDVALIFNVLAADGFIPKGLYTVDTHAEPAAPPEPAEKSDAKH
jgi:hypothetical protein